jgi:ketosteroid isomerase-like protein
MSQENVEVVRRFEALMAAREDGGPDAVQKRFAEIMSLLDENVAFRPTESVPGHGGEWFGHHGFLDMCKAYGTVWHPPEDFEIELRDAGADTVVVLASFTRRAKATGTSIPIKMVEIVTVRDGRITELVPYFHDTVPMLDAAGVRVADA